MTAFATQGGIPRDLCFLVKEEVKVMGCQEKKLRRLTVKQRFSRGWQFCFMPVSIRFWRWKTNSNASCTTSIISLAKSQKMM